MSRQQHWQSKSFQRKLAEIERQLNKRGFQTEPNERELWLSVTRYKKQSQVVGFFLMEESIDRVVEEVKAYFRYA